MKNMRRGGGEVVMVVVGNSIHIRIKGYKYIRTFYDHNDVDDDYDDCNGNYIVEDRVNSSI